MIFMLNVKLSKQAVIQPSSSEVLEAIPIHQQCRTSDGFILSPDKYEFGQQQCFRAILDEPLSWFASLARCQEMGMTLAEPNAAVAVWLQKILNGKHGMVNNGDS